MAKKRTPKQQLVDLYEKELKENTNNRYHLHEDMGEHVIAAAQAAAAEEYRNAVKLFGRTLDEVIEDFGGCADNVPVYFDTYDEEGRQD